MSENRRPLLLLCAAQFMLVLDFAIVNVALPWIREDLGFSTGLLPWVVGAYALFFGGFLLVGGRAGDLIGRKRIFVVGIAVFTLASLVGGLATAPLVLVVARALQGLSAAAVSPAVLALIAAGYPEGPERAKAMGVFGAVSSMGFTGGVLTGGVLTELFGWRSIMFINVPVGIVLAVLASRRLVADRGTRGRRIDWPGAALVTAGMCAISFALTVATERGWGDSTVIIDVVAGIALVAAFLALQTRVESPLVPLSIFRNRELVGGDSIAFLSGGVMSISTFFLTLYMQQVLGYSAILTGIAFFPQAFVVVLASLPVARMTGRMGARPLLLGGGVCLIAGSALLMLVAVVRSFPLIVLPGGILLGLGVTVMMISTAVSATSGVEPAQLGLASGLYNSSRQLGVGLCLGVGVALASAAGTGERISLAGFQVAFGLSAALSLALVLIAAFVLSSEPPVGAASETLGSAAQPAATNATGPVALRQA
jgi:EmrB/QacA subfamily drug resistance transporter